MIPWTMKLVRETAEAFNEGEKQTEIAARLGTTRKAISRVLCRIRADGVLVERRSGTKRKGQAQS